MAALGGQGNWLAVRGRRVLPIAVFVLRFLDEISMCLRDMHREETDVICVFAMAWVAASHRSRTGRLTLRYG